MDDRRLTVLTGWERTPWHATQRAAWEALKRWKNPTVMLSRLLLLLAVYSSSSSASGRKLRCDPGELNSVAGGVVEPHDAQGDAEHVVVPVPVSRQVLAPARA